MHAAEGFYRRQRSTNGNLLDPDAIEKHRKSAHRIADYFVSLPRARMVVRRSANPFVVAPSVNATRSARSEYAVSSFMSTR